VAKAKTTTKKREQKSIPLQKKRFSLISEAISELKKVSWPSREETQRLFIMVLAVCIITGAVLWAIDLGFSEFMDRTILK
jgi:preprotein translocase subunit SecE